MKFSRIMLAALMLGSVNGLLLGCGSGEDPEATEDKVVAVQRGDLTIDITAVGNLALSHRESLAFEIAGTVEEVVVEEGDSVEEGQLLVKLDASVWQDQVDTLERQLETEKQNLLQAELNLTNAEIALNDAESSLDEVNSAVYQESYSAQAELSVANAKIAVASAEESYEWAKDLYERNWTEPEWVRNYEQKTAQLAIAEIELKEAEEALANVRTDIEEMIGDAELELEKKQKDLAVVQSKLEDAQKAVEEAQGDLDETVEAGYQLNAPSAGFITVVHVSDGDEVVKGAVAVEIADPDKFEADILVSEMDIFQVELGGEAWVEVDALDGATFPARVTQISPVATVQSGVVNYEVKVEIDSLEAVAGEQQAFMDRPMEGLAEGEIPENLQQAVEEGLITQEQVDEMMEQIRSGEMPIRQGEGEGRGLFPADGSEGQVPSAAGDDLTQPASSEGFQLREGLTVTVSIIVDNRDDVLLVPNSAITSSGRQSYVRVMSADGIIEERVITTGVSDWQYTEVVEGLSEGEQVVVPETSATTTNTMPQGPGGGEIQIFRDSGR